jgi:hypothetical protein
VWNLHANDLGKGFGDKTANGKWTRLPERLGMVPRTPRPHAHGPACDSAEIAKLQEHNGLDAASLAPGCFVYCVSRIKRQTVELQTLFVVLEPQGDMDEADCMAAWYEAEDVLAGQIRRLAS